MRRVNTRQIEYFVAIAEERQITAAAARLHISQPPLSRELARMERELGVRLVVRGPRSVELTEAGKLLYRRCREVLELTGAMEREVESFGSGSSGVVSLGLVSSSGASVPSDAMAPFVDDYPNVRFDVHEGNTFEVIDMLNRGIVELGFVRTPFERGQLCCRYGAPVPMAAVMPARFAVGERSDVVMLAELSGVPLVIYRRYRAVPPGGGEPRGGVSERRLPHHVQLGPPRLRRGARAAPDVRDRQHGGASRQARGGRGPGHAACPGARAGPQAVSCRRALPGVLLVLV